MLILTMHMIFHVVILYGYMVHLKTYNYELYHFRFALAFYGNPTRPQLVALIAQVRDSLHVYILLYDICCIQNSSLQVQYQ
jgi:hypothetical protein